MDQTANGTIVVQSAAGKGQIKTRIPKRLMTFEDPRGEFPFKKPRIPRPLRRNYMLVQALGAPNKRSIKEIIPAMEGLMTDFDTRYRGWVEDQRRLMTSKLEEFKELKMQIEIRSREAGLEQPHQGQ